MMCITFLQNTQKILTKYVFHWLELITEILSFSETLPEHQQKKKNISGIFWAFKNKLQIIHTATYVALFLLCSINSLHRITCL